MDEERFEVRARAVFRYQLRENGVYRRYCKALGRTEWNGWAEAPALPVEAFKQAPVTCFPPGEADRIFSSSGTGTGRRSRHYVRDLSYYDVAAGAAFEEVFGSGPFTFLAHLPGYEEGGDRSSLVYMADLLIERFGGPASGRFLKERDVLREGIARSRTDRRPFILLGAAFGLLDLVEERPVTLPDGARVIETGGMKTHRREMARSELHDRLAEGFGIGEDQVVSEYGMCELLSQCYSRGDGCFRPPPWMRMRVVDPERPEQSRATGRSGALAVFDLANVHSVSALLTGDRAIERDGGFEILGRLPRAELRGCNFLFE